MQVSRLCRDFITSANASQWNNAVSQLNGLNMYEMLRALKALDTNDIAALQTALARAAGSVNAPRIEYALSVVTTSRLPATAPGDLNATGQVAVARTFAARPRSIFVEPIPKGEVAVRNTGLSSPGNALMTERFGEPRTTYNQTCQAIEDKTLKARMSTANVGPFRATGLDSAITSLTGVFTTVATEQRLVYRALTSAGMLCARNVRGSKTSISNHSWGTAIDLKIDGELDARGDDETQFGLELIAPIFNAAGWYWGIDFRTEDSQHFEAGRTLVSSW